MEQWKDLLAFNRSERRGIWLLMILIITGTAANQVLKRSKSDAGLVRVSVIFEETLPLVEGREREYRSWDKSAKPTKVKRDSLFYFDPNTLTAELWQKLGLSEKQAAVITRYTSGGGRFRQKEDLRKSFVISDSFYAKVEPWIRIAPQTNTERDHKEYVQQGADRNSICINRADTTELKRLRGVGSVLASRIVSYRSSIGGFYSVDQLTEVYGLTEEVIASNLSRLTIDNNNIRTIAINEASEKTLESHPYISKRLAYVLVTMREESPLRGDEDLLKRLPPGIKLPNNLLPYLTY